MDENNDFIDDDIEILDFDDDIPQKRENDDEIEILDFEEEKAIEEENLIEIVTSIEDKKEEPEKKEFTNEIVSNNINLQNDEEPKEDNEKLFINENLIEEDIPKKDIENIVEEPKTVTVKKLNKKAVFIGLLIFITLILIAVSLPFINNYVTNKETKNSNINTNKETNSSETKEINIDVDKILSQAKEYTNYEYQNINDIYSKDNKNSTLAIKNTYIYLFNETKFSVEINKKVSDFDYKVKDYYEKLDDVYNTYINDITTNSINKRNTTKEEFDNLINMYPKTIEYLIANHKVLETKELVVDGKNHINVTLETEKEILNNLSIETDRIQNKIDINKLNSDNVKVELFLDENERLYEINIVIEDKAACQENLDNEVSSAVLKYIFKNLNKIGDIELPKTQ